MIRIHVTAGFTLIETIIYIALLSVLITSAMYVFGSITETVRNDQDTLTIVQEGNFVLGKLAWAYRSASPPIQFQLNPASSTIEMKVANGPFIPLTTENVRAEDLSISSLSKSTVITFSLNGHVFHFRHTFP